MSRLILAAVLIAGLMPVSVRAQQEAPSTEEQLAEVKGVLDGLNESFTEYRGYVDALRKIKISGYLQTQFRYTDVINAPWTIGNFSGRGIPGEHQERVSGAPRTDQIQL